MKIDFLANVIPANSLIQRGSGKISPMNHTNFFIVENFFVILYQFGAIFAERESSSDKREERREKNPDGEIYRALQCCAEARHCGLDPQSPAIHNALIHRQIELVKNINKFKNQKSKIEC